jgi:uncharacterized membrane protein YdbT with pleckstrin-like domain
MSERTQRLRGRILAVIAAGIAVVAIVANLVHSGKMLWGGLVIVLLALVVWQGLGRKVDGA